MTNDTKQTKLIENRPHSDGVAFTLATERMGFEKNKRLVKNYNNVRTVAEVGGKQCKFRSKLEYKVAQYLQMLKVSGHIKDWDFEMMNFEFPDDKWLIDFTVRNNDDTISYIEAKGRIEGRDRKKLRLVAKYYPQVIIDYVFAAKRDALKMKTSAKYCRRVCVLRSRGGIYDLCDLKAMGA